MHGSLRLGRLYVRIYIYILHPIAGPFVCENMHCAVSLGRLYVKMLMWEPSVGAHVGTAVRDIEYALGVSWIDFASAASERFVHVLCRFSGDPSS